MILDDINTPGIYIVEGSEYLENRLVFLAKDPECYICKMPNFCSSVHVLPGSGNLFYINEHAPEKVHGQLTSGTREIVRTWRMSDKQVLEIRDGLQKRGYLK